MAAHLLARKTAGSGQGLAVCTKELFEENLFSEDYDNDSDSGDAATDKFKNDKAKKDCKKNKNLKKNSKTKTRKQSEKKANLKNQKCNKRISEETKSERDSVTESSERNKHSFKKSSSARPLSNEEQSPRKPSMIGGLRRPSSFTLLNRRSSFSDKLRLNKSSTSSSSGPSQAEQLPSRVENARERNSLTPKAAKCLGLDADGKVIKSGKNSRRFSISRAFSEISGLK